MREMASQGIEPDSITYNAAISACEECGAVLYCDALYAEAYAAGLLDHRLQSSPTDMDLHNFVTSTSRAAVRFVLTDLRRTASSSCLMGDLQVVTGSPFSLSYSSHLSLPSPSHYLLLPSPSLFEIAPPFTLRSRGLLICSPRAHSLRSTLLAFFVLLSQYSSLASKLSCVSQGGGTTLSLPYPSRCQCPLLAVPTEHSVSPVRGAARWATGVAERGDSSLPGGPGAAGGAGYGQRWKAHSVRPRPPPLDCLLPSPCPGTRRAVDSTAQ